MDGSEAGSISDLLHNVRIVADRYVTRLGIVYKALLTIRLFLIICLYFRVQVMQVTLPFLHSLSN